MEGKFPENGKEANQSTSTAIDAAICILEFNLPEVLLKQHNLFRISIVKQERRNLIGHGFHIQLAANIQHAIAQIFRCIDFQFLVGVSVIRSHAIRKEENHIKKITPL
jgi:hypothetical protein